MFRDECAAAVALWKLLPVIKRKLDGSYVRAKHYIGNNGSGNKFRMFLLHARVDIVADVAVRPAVKPAIFQRGKVIRRKVISQTVAFVNRRPDLPGSRLERQPHWIPEPGCVEPRIFPVRIADGHGGTARIFPRVNIGMGTHCNEKMLAVGRKSQRPCAMPTRWQVHQMFLSAE